MGWKENSSVDVDSVYHALKVLCNPNSSVHESSSNNIFWKLWTFNACAPTSIGAFFVDNVDGMDAHTVLALASILLI